jgi:uncharacterized membrane protein
MTALAIVLAIAGHAFLTANWDKTNGNDVCGVVIGVLLFIVAAVVAFPPLS